MHRRTQSQLRHRAWKLKTALRENARLDMIRNVALLRSRDYECWTATELKELLLIFLHGGKE